MCMDTPGKQLRFDPIKGWHMADVEDQTESAIEPVVTETEAAKPATKTKLPKPAKKVK